MKKQTKILIVLGVPALLGLIVGFAIGFAVGRGSSKNKDKAPEIEQSEAVAEVPEVVEPEEVNAQSDSTVNTAREIIYYRNRLPYAKMFNDMNDVHLEVAQKVGLKSIPKMRSDVEANSRLVKLSDNDCYVLDEMRYSVPYLTPNAASELYRIASAFRDSLQNHKLLDYKLIVTSVLRTEEDIKRLRKSGNPNSVENSAHCYGTTFDITYVKYYREDESEAFMQPFELTKVLGEVLSDRKKAGAVLVKYERKEHCFHITCKK